MRVLVLDDDRERQKIFSQLLKGKELVQAYSYRLAIDALNGDKFNLVYMDYELGDFSIPPELLVQNKIAEAPITAIDGYRELTGLDVATYIATGLPTFKVPDEVVIHSWDTGGAQLMADVLKARVSKVSYQKFRTRLR